jgi:Ran GTPase-activating protein (RanGAP) involved in mRNA processing and transport
MNAGGWLNIAEENYEEEEEEGEEDEMKQKEDGFIFRDGDDIGWLGYFIGRNEQVQKITIHHMHEEKIIVLMKDVKHNRSIDFFECISHYGTIQGNDIIDSLSCFIIHNNNLKALRLWYVDIGLDCARSLALALNQRQEKSLTAFHLKQNNLSNEALAEITAALSGYKQLKSLGVGENLIGRDQKYYDTLAQIIDLGYITSSNQNAETLRRLRDDDLALTGRGEEVLTIADYESDFGNHFYTGEDDDDNDDWGWLAYFVGRSKQIRKLCLSYLPEEGDKIDAFMEGLNRNQSIEFLDVRCHIEGDVIIDSLSTFITNNSHLTKLELWYVNIGVDCARSLALALNKRQQKTLTRFVLVRNHLDDEGLVAITSSLIGYPLETLSVAKNLIGREGCVSLGLIATSAALHLKNVWVSNVSMSGNDFDDESLQILAVALANTTTLQTLTLSENSSITAAGLRALSSLFRSACPVETLHLEDMNIGDDGAEALTAALAGNTSLKHLTISPDSAGITRTGWSAFSKLLCDTSSINNTYQSNHTLEHIGGKYYCFRARNGDSLFYSGDEFSGEILGDIPHLIARHLIMNKYCPNDAARLKIFTCHADLAVETLFKYKLAFLPSVVSGYLSARQYCIGKKYWNCRVPSTWELASRRLSSTYKFVRGMPLLVADGYQIQVQRDFISSPCERCGRKRKFIDTTMTDP